jgi:hypothetical protein
MATLSLMSMKIARKAAADQLYGLRKNNITHKETARKIVRKHGRHRSDLPGKMDKKTTKNHAQGKLPL